MSALNAVMKHADGWVDALAAAPGTRSSNNESLYHKQYCAAVTGRKAATHPIRHHPALSHCHRSLQRISHACLVK